VTKFEVIDAKRYMCGRMSRMLRGEHQAAALRVGIDVHRGLRQTFDKSFYRKAWLIDGTLAGLGGAMGTILDPGAFIWVALSERATRYPLEIVREARRQIDYLMRTKLELHTTIIGGDDAARRFVAFLGFHARDAGPGSAAFSCHGRRQLNDFLQNEEGLRYPAGNGYVIPVGYHPEGA